MSTSVNPPRGTKEDIQSFLAAKHIAIIGLSRDPKSYSRSVARELQKRDYVVSGVNLFASKLDGIPVVLRIADLHPRPEAVLVILPPEASDEAVLSCIQCDIGKIWVRGRERDGSVSAGVANLVREQAGILIDGFCPIMFLSSHGFPHNVHHAIYRWFDLEPK
jgi:predicted CoA-binding protein